MGQVCLKTSTKQCAMCKDFKKFEEFNKCKRANLGLHNHCKECQKQYRRDWYLKNREQEISKASKYSKSVSGKECRQRSYTKNREKLLERNRKARATPHARKLAGIARKKIYENNVSFRMSVNLRSRIRTALKNNTKSESSNKLLGCSLDDFKKYMESKFVDGMNWKNYGQKGWHIDHILPCDSFDLSNEEEQKKCFHYTNLQPLWWRDNISKGNKIESNYQS